MQKLQRQEDETRKRKRHSSINSKRLPGQSSYAGLTGKQFATAMPDALLPAVQQSPLIDQKDLACIKIL